MDKLNAVNQDEDNAPAPVNSSKLFMRSVGRAAMNIDGTNRELEVIPLEEIGYVDGEINTEQETIAVGGVDAEGNSFTSQINTSNTIIAEWFPMYTNRVNPPNIRRGERVLLWQYADSDKYYWTPTGFDEGYRRKESVVFRVSNSNDESDTTVSPDNSYWVEISTIDKHLTISTSKNDGEEFQYTMQIDTKNSRFTLCDDADNFIELLSPEKKITVCNADDTHVVLDKKTLTLKAPQSINIEAPMVTIKAATTTISSGSTSIEGGTATMKGTYNVLGDYNFKGKVTSNGKDISSTHNHVNSGGPGPGGPVA